MADAPRVTICVPCRDDVKSLFALSLTRMSAYSSSGGVQLIVRFMRTAILPVSRIGLVEMALQHEAEWILFLDSDMAFPKETLMRLLSHDKDIVTAAYSTRDTRAKFIAVDTDERDLEYDPRQAGLQRISRSGLGVTLIRASVFERIPRPWFMYDYDPDRRERQLAEDPKRYGAGFNGEDTWFYSRALEAGFEVWLDWDLSHQVGHVGEFTYHPGRRYLPNDHFLDFRPVSKR